MLKDGQGHEQKPDECAYLRAFHVTNLNKWHDFALKSLAKHSAKKLSKECHTFCEDSPPKIQQTILNKKGWESNPPLFMSRSQCSSDEAHKAKEANRNHGPLLERVRETPPNIPKQQANVRTELIHNLVCKKNRHSAALS